MRLSAFSYRLACFYSAGLPGAVQGRPATHCYFLHIFAVVSYVCSVIRGIDFLIIIQQVEWALGESGSGINCVINRSGNLANAAALPAVWRTDPVQNSVYCVPAGLAGCNVLVPVVRAPDEASDRSERGRDDRYIE